MTPNRKKLLTAFLDVSWSLNHAQIAGSETLPDLINQSSLGMLLNDIITSDLWAQWYQSNPTSRSDADSFLASFLEAYRSYTVTVAGSSYFYQWQNVIANFGQSHIDNITNAQGYLDRWMFLAVYKKASGLIGEAWIPYLNGIVANENIAIEERQEAYAYAQGEVSYNAATDAAFAKFGKTVGAVVGAVSGQPIVSVVATTISQQNLSSELSTLKTEASTTIAPTNDVQQALATVPAESPVPTVLTQAVKAQEIVSMPIAAPMSKSLTPVAMLAQSKVQQEKAKAKKDTLEALLIPGLGIALQSLG